MYEYVSKKSSFRVSNLVLLTGLPSLLVLPECVISYSERKRRFALLLLTALYSDCQRALALLLRSQAVGAEALIRSEQLAH